MHVIIQCFAGFVAKEPGGCHAGVTSPRSGLRSRMWSTSNEVAPDPAIGAVKTVGREGDGLIGKTPTLGVVSNCARQDAVSAARTASAPSCPAARVGQSPPTGALAGVAAVLVVSRRDRARNVDKAESDGGGHEDGALQRVSSAATEIARHVGNPKARRAVCGPGDRVCRLWWCSDWT